MIILKKGKTEIKIGDNSFASCSQTGDGLYFKTKEGFEINLVDQYMPNATKENITFMINKPSNGKNITVDLMKYNNPISIEIL